MSSKVESSFDTPVSSSNFPSFLVFLESKAFCTGLSHVSGRKPQVGAVVVAASVVGGVVVAVTVVEGVVDVNNVEVVVACEVDEVLTGEVTHPIRVADTMMLSKLPPMVVAAPPKLSTPKPIQSRV